MDFSGKDIPNMMFGKMASLDQLLPMDGFFSGLSRLMVLITWVLLPFNVILKNMHRNWPGS